jgi:uncharacterized protein (DUF58 family)
VTEDTDSENLFDEAFQRRLEYLALVSRRLYAGRDRAERRTRKAGSGVEFADYQRYYPGADFRQIDWNVYGRIDRLVLRLQEQEEDLSVHLLLDCSGSMAFGTPTKLAYGKKLVAALAYVALGHLDRVSVTALRDSVFSRLPEGRGRARIFSVFDFLRPLRAEGRTALADSVGTFVAQNKRRGLSILVSDLYDPTSFELALDRLRYARFEPSVVQIIDPQEAEPSVRGDVLLVDRETGEERAVTLTPRVLERYRAAYRGRQDALAAACVQKQVPLFTLDLRVPPEEAMLSVLRAGGLVA